jgi:hypothetical protein
MQLKNTTCCELGTYNLDKPRDTATQNANSELTHKLLIFSVLFAVPNLVRVAAPAGERAFNLLRPARLRFLLSPLKLQETRRVSIVAGMTPVSTPIHNLRIESWWRCTKTTKMFGAFGWWTGRESVEMRQALRREPGFCCSRFAPAKVFRSHLRTAFPPICRALRGYNWRRAARRRVPSDPLEARGEQPSRFAW